MSKEKEKVQNNENEEVNTPEEVIDGEDTQKTEENTPKDRVTELEEKLSEWEDKYKRLYAEFDNYQKRTAKEKDARYSDAVVDTVAVFLEVADNLQRAVSIEVETDEAKKVLEGVELVKKQMSDILSKMGVTPIKACGEEFDPNVHNAVMHIEDDKIAENTVVEELQKGYIYKNERVVRYSMVKVAN